MPKTRRRRVIVDDSALATAIGERLRAARHRARMTQQQLAEGRYTKAYVSALEKGLAKPSMAALTFFSDRLGLPPSHFLSDGLPAWTLLEADIALASGRWDDAVDGYEAVQAAAADPQTRARALLGLAEALCRLEHVSRAIAPASEAADLFRAADRPGDAALATYWLSCAHYMMDNATEAVALLRMLLEQVRGGLEVTPDFQMRLLMAMALALGRSEDHETALTYLEEARGLASDLDDRRRGLFYLSLAYSYRRTGDYEAAIRTGQQALALYRAVDSELQIARVECELALTYKALDNLERAGEHARVARTLAAGSHEDRLLAHVADAEARIALAGGDHRRAIELTDEALQLAQDTDNDKARVDALVTRAQALEASGDAAAAAAAWQEAGQRVRDSGSKGRMREVLTDWAASLARQGQHEQAYALTREALEAKA